MMTNTSPQPMWISSHRHQIFLNLFFFSLERSPTQLEHPHATTSVSSFAIKVTPLLSRGALRDTQSEWKLLISISSTSGRDLMVSLEPVRFVLSRVLDFRSDCNTYTYCNLLQHTHPHRCSSDTALHMYFRQSKNTCIVMCRKCCYIC